jgi:hypothetical protein
MLKEEYIKVPDGLDQQIFSKIKVKKVSFFKTRLKIYSVAASIVLAIIISLNVLTVKLPVFQNINVANKTNIETTIDHDIFNDDELLLTSDIFNDDELLLAYDGLYNEGFEVSYDLLDEEQTFSYEDELYEDIAFLENM